MNKKLSTILATFLVVSLSTNLYLYSKMNVFKEAWLNQFITTSEIETILKSSSKDLSIEAVKQISVSAFGKENVRVVDIENEFTEYGSDKVALGVNDTLIFFKNGVYHGSKSNLRNH